MTKASQFGLSQDVVEKICLLFSKYPEIQKVVLYGSRAKGNFRPSSDIDLTLFADRNDLSFLFRIENELDDLLLPYKIDLSLYDQIENQRLKDHIDRVGKVFFSR